MYKRNLLLLFMLLGAWFARASTYTFVHIKGEIKLKASGGMAKVGDSVGEADELVFSAPEAWGIVVHAEKGRFLIKPDASASGAFESTVQAALKPAGAPVAPKDAPIFAQEAGVAGYFGQKANETRYYKGRILVISGYEKFKVAPSFKLSAGSFFFMRYVYNGLSLNKGLPAEGDFFFIDKGEIYMHNGEEVLPDGVESAELCYYDDAKGEYRAVCPFVASFLSEDDFKRDVEAMLPYLKTLKTNEAIMGEVMGYLADAYGKPSKAAVERYLSRHFTLLK